MRVCHKSSARGVSPHANRIVYAFAQVKEFSREHGIALVMNLAQVMSSLQSTVMILPPCGDEMEVCNPFMASSNPLLRSLDPYTEA